MTSENEKCSGRAVFEVVSAPILEKVDRRSVKEFYRKRQIYLKKIEEQQETTGDLSITGQGLLTTVDPTLLRTIAPLLIGKEKKDVVESDVAMMLARILKERSGESRGNLDALMAPVKMDLRIRDVLQRVVSFFAAMDKVVDEEGLENDFETKEGVKTKIKYLLKGIRPEQVRNLVTDDLRTSHGSAQKDPKEFFQLLLKHAKEQQVYRQPDHAKADLESRKKPKPNSTIPVEERKDGRSRKETVGKGAKASEWKQQTKNVECFHCGKPHSLKVCPTATPEEKKRCWDEFNQRKKGTTT